MKVVEKLLVDLLPSKISQDFLSTVLKHTKADKKYFRLSKNMKPFEPSLIERASEPPSRFSLSLTDSSIRVQPSRRAILMMKFKKEKII